MPFEPEFPAFETKYGAGEPQLVCTRLIADLETPVSVLLKLAKDEPNSFLLESVEGGNIRGRFSIIGCKPDVIWKANGSSAQINRNAQFSDTFETCEEDTLSSLRSFLTESQIDFDDTLPKMAAGVFGYLGYDTVRLIEHLPAENPDPIGIPDGLFIRPTIVAVFDAVKDEIILSTPVRAKTGVNAHSAYAQACERLQVAIADIERTGSSDLDAPTNVDVLPAPTSNTSKADYLKMVERAKEYIAAGDIFQVVPSQRFQMPFELPPFALYRALRRINPSPYLYYLNFDSFAVVGSSPEILVQVQDDDVTIRPIAGTRPRGETPEKDQALARELLEDPKELAEHLMLLDLGRNDTGRVSKIGSVEVTEQFVIEYYSHVMHIVSNVAGRLDRANYDEIAALMAGFPAGTVSGAPKVRAMEIIDELEKEKRGLYAGCVGYFSAKGDMNTCIVLRTALVKDSVLYVQAGGGVVADSDPEAEYEETVNKAKALVHAAEEAVRFAHSSQYGQ